MGRVLIRFRLVFSLLFPLIFAAVLILRPEIASGGAAKGLSLCFSVLIPSLFPFFICSNLISELRFGERLGQKLQGIMEVRIFRILAEPVMEKKMEQMTMAASRISELRRMFVSRLAMICPCSAS